jgi:hypothetical protein
MEKYPLSKRVFIAILTIIFIFILYTARDVILNSSFVLYFLIALPIAAVIPMMIALAIRVDIKSRENLFQKISTEYGFNLEYFYAKNFFNDYMHVGIKLRMSGLIRGHDVLIEDVIRMGQNPVGRMQISRPQTVITVDGAKYILNKDKQIPYAVAEEDSHKLVSSLPFIYPASYEEIKAALDGLTSGDTNQSLTA